MVQDAAPAQLWSRDIGRNHAGVEIGFLRVSDQAFSPYRHALGEDYGIVRSHAILGRRHDLATVNVNRTQPLVSGIT
jgi:hypothetical protein